MSTQIVQPVHWLVDGDMSAVSITSPVLQREYSDNLGFQMIWTGTPVGTFAIQVSLDYNASTGAGDWDTVTPAIAFTAPAGGASHSYAELRETCAAYVRLVYTKTSGTGTLQGWTSAKAI